MAKGYTNYFDLLNSFIPLTTIPAALTERSPVSV